MADLTGTTPANTYKGLLQVNDYTDGVDATAKYIQDGEGTDSALAISTGNVGIGTTSPAAPLHIVGTSSSTLILERDSANITALSSIIFKDGSDDQVRISSTDSKFLFETEAPGTPRGYNIRLLIDSDGNVGIGTEDPSELLHLSATIKPVIRLEGSGSDALNTNFGEIQFYNRDGSADGPNVAASIHAQSTASTGSGGSLVFSTEDSTAVEEGRPADPRMVIDEKGNVGIGTTSPAYKLEVKEATNSTYAAKIFNNGGDSYGLLVKTSSGTDEDYPILDLENTSSNVFRVQANGNVGIGTTSFGATAAGVLAINNGTAPTSSPADMVQLYAEDVTLSSELRVRDEAGNVTTLSPHAKDAPDSLYDQGKGVDEMHRVANHYLGTITFTNVDRRNDLLQKQLNGEELPVDRTFKVTETFTEYNARTGADLQVEDWDANQQAMFDEQEEKVVARQAEIDAWDNEEEEAPAPLESYVKKPKPEWLS